MQVGRGNKSQAWVARRPVRSATPNPVGNGSDEPGASAAPVLACRPDGQLVAYEHGMPVAVRLCRCFPWSASTRYLSLRDEADREVALVREPSALDAASRDALHRALIEASMVFEVTRVEEVEEDFEMRSFRVQTRSGLRTFQTARDAFLRPSHRGGWLIEDVQGDIFWVPPAEQLDRRSREWLWAHID